MNILEFKNAKRDGKKLSMVTCYDHWSARILNETAVDAILVGDSAAMVMHGYPSTIHATVPMMALHTAAVARGAPNKLIVADLPFLSFRKGVRAAMNAAEQLMQAGAHAVKLEGVRGHEAIVQHIVDSGVPLMGHVGLIPQSIHQFGGFKVQGRETQAADVIFQEALELEKRGAFSIVLECVPTSLAVRITESIGVPTIGIGAGPETDGQILVLQDLLGAQKDFTPRFLRKYADLHTAVHQAVSRFDHDVKDQSYPTAKESYL